MGATNICSCFQGLCLGRNQNYDLLQERGLHLHEEEPWLLIKLKKLKEFSEVVAGPKWKNLIRKIGKICHPKGYSKQSAAAAAQFQYSPESYALNFAGDEDCQDDGVLLHSFSTRFAPHAAAAARPPQ